jgi:hypothetical protein
MFQLRRSHMRRAAQAALFVCVLLCGQVPARAAISIAVAPPLIEKVSRPGSTIRDVILFRNAGTEALDVSVTFVDFTVNEDGSVAERPPGLDPSSILPYAQVTPLRARVEPNQQVNFRYTIRTPADFKQLRTMVMFAGTPQVARAGNQVVFAPRVGVPLYVESTAARPAQLEVSDVRWSRSSEAPEKIVLSMLVRNSGDRNIRPTGTVQVRSAADRFNQTFQFNEGREPVLPGQKRVWTMTFGPVPGGELSVSLRFATSFRDTFVKDDRVPSSSP